MMTFFINCKHDKGTKSDVSTPAEINASESGVSFNVLKEESKIHWEGYKPTGTHRGTINLKNGSVIVADHVVTGGQFVIDMNSIEVTDLEGDQKANLLAHLKGTASGKENDFFNVAQYPEAIFEISKCIELKSGGDANTMIYGNLTIKKVTKQIGFKARVDVTGDRMIVHVPKFNIDRTQWGINFRSKKLSELADSFINDEVGLTMDIVALK